MSRALDPEQTSHLAVLHAAVAEAAFRAGAKSVGLVDLTQTPGMNLELGSVGVTYSDGARRGDMEAAIQLTCRVVGDRTVPDRDLPTIGAKLTAASVDRLPSSLAEVPEAALPVVITAWALSRLEREDRLRFLDSLQDAAARRIVAWVSIEGVGVAPGVPTLGDRRASGHSIIGVALLSRSKLRIEAVGRCWSRGKVIEWLAD